MKNLLYCLLTVLFYTEGVARAATNIDKEIGQIVLTSFRLLRTETPKMDSLKRVAEAIGDARLLSFNDFLNKQWHLRYGSPEEVAKADAAIDDIAKNSRFIDLRGHAFFWKGTYIFYVNKEYTKGLSYFLTGKKLLEEVHFENFSYAMDYYKGMMDVYCYFADYKKAIYYCEQALQLPESDLYGRQSLYNDLGIYYARSGVLDKAEQAYYLGIEFCKKHNLTSFETMIRGNLGNLLRLRGDYKGALPYYYESLRKNEKEIPESVALDRIYLAKCLLQLDSIDKAKAYLTPVKMPFWAQTGYDKERFEALALYYEKTGNFALAAHYKDSLLAVKDTIRVQHDNRELIVLESNLQAEKYMNERKILENGHYWRNIIIIGLIAVFGALAYWFFQKRKHERVLAHQEQLLAEEKRQRAEALLEKANQQLTQYVANIKKKNDLIERISQELEASASAHKLSEAEKARYIESMQHTTLLTEADWSEFKHLFEQVFPSFFILLEKNYPELNPAELRLLALEKLTMPDKDRGAMLAISTESVKKSRYRLRKKYPELLGEVLN